MPTDLDARLEPALTRIRPAVPTSPFQEPRAVALATQQLENMLESARYTALAFDEDHSAARLIEAALIRMQRAVMAESALPILVAYQTALEKGNR